MSDINDVFNAHEQRKAEEVRRAQQKRHDADAAQQRGTILFKEVIVPVMQNLTTVIRQRGYQADIQELIDGYPHPSVTFSFNPSHTKALLTASTLQYTYRDSGTADSLEMSNTVYRQKGIALDHQDTRISIDIASVTPERVRVVIIDFLRRVLAEA
jgi:hypothetical protein